MIFGVVRQLMIDEKNDKKPYISVIITAHDRKEFLKEAINSVINQTLDKSFYEIIVVKNFKDEKIDSYIEKNGVINIYTEEIELSKKIMIGIKKANGEIISFLEDDDIFYPKKLEIIYKKFKNDLKLGFYHNTQSGIDEDDKHIIRNYSQDIYISDNDKKNFNYFLIKKISGNNSSISIRKNAIINFKEKIIKFNYNIDQLIFLLIFFTNFNLLHENNILTKYRIHNSWSNIFTFNFDYYKQNKELKLRERIKFINIFEDLFKDYIEKYPNIQEFLFFDKINKII
jgi:glycosyltransferase involved in cell wall biosynthesis